MKPLRVRYNRIQREVSQLLANLNITEPLVPVEKIAQLSGATIAYQDFNNEVSGLLLRQGKTVTIAVAKEQSPARQRFTIAHELGHLLLHEGDAIHIDKDFRVNLRSEKSSTAEDVEEIEANTFAAEILMPTAFLRQDVQQLTLDIEDAEQVEKLAKRYGVSTQAMTFRLLNVFGSDLV